MAHHRDHMTDEARDKNPGAGEQTGEAVGGIGGTLAGAAIGSAAGPIGTIIGGIAGAAGGWWAGEKAGRALEDWSDEDEKRYKEYHQTLPENERRPWDEARVGYMVGHVARHNPDYKQRKWEDVEPELQKGWTGVDYDYDAMRPYVRHGYTRTDERR